MRRVVRLSFGLVMAFAMPCVSLDAQTPSEWRLVRELTIGADAQGDQYIFGRISAVLATDDLVVIVEPREARVRVYSGASGEYLRTIGRYGAGPGEFRSVLNVGILRDSFWVADVSLRRTSVLDLHGRVGSTVSWDGDGTRADVGAQVVRGVLPEGRAWGDPNRPASSLGERETPQPILALRRSGETVDTIVTLETEHTRFAVVNDGAINFGPQPYPDSPLLVPRADGPGFYVVGRRPATSRSVSTIEVTSIASTGDTLWRTDLRYRPVRIARDTIEATVARLHGGMRRSGATIEQVRAALFLPAFRPPVSAALASAEGQLWLRREGGETLVHYWIVDSSGRLAGTLSVPASVSLMAVRGDTVWGTEIGTDDIPRVVRFRLLK